MSMTVLMHKFGVLVKAHQTLSTATFTARSPSSEAKSSPPKFLALYGTRSWSPPLLKPPVVTTLTSVQRIRPSPRYHVTFRNTLSLTVTSLYPFAQPPGWKSIHCHLHVTVGPVGLQRPSISGHAFRPQPEVHHVVMTGTNLSWRQILFIHQ